MLIDLPKTFRLNGKRECDYAEVENWFLHIYGNVSFRKLMYEITYCLKENGHCYYCRTSISKSDSSLDHIYAQNVGGPTIPNNLVPCCKKCNSLKSNLSCEEYKKYLNLSESSRKRYAKIVRNRKDNNKANGILEIPDSWLSNADINSLDFRIYEDNFTKGKKSEKVRGYYDRYHHFKNPVIIDKNGVVLEGTNIIIFAIERGIKEILTIKLENVIVHKQFKG